MYSINNKLAVIVFLLLGNIAMAQQVTRQEAIKAATRIQVIEDELSASSISDVYTKVHNGDTLLFEVDFDNGGFVILSGNKFCEPVLGYGILSENCSLHGIINHYDEIPDGLRTFIDTYEAQIKSCFLQNNIVNQHTEWETLLNEPYTPTNQVRRVNPLLETKWGQSSSNNGWGHAYNYYVNSIDTNCHNCPAGCVPVAMAQILKYWEEPEENPSWCIQYDWDNMPDELIDDGSSLYVTQRNAVAKLIKDCGASVNVQYCPSGSGCQSGASISNAPNALQQFGFNEAEYKEKLHLFPMRQMPYNNSGLMKLNTKKNPSSPKMIGRRCFVMIWIWVILFFIEEALLLLYPVMLLCVMVIKSLYHLISTISIGDGVGLPMVGLH